VTHERKTYYLDRILDRLQAGKLSPETERLFREWLADPKDQKIKEKILGSLFELIVIETNNPSDRAYEMLEEIIARIRETEQEQGSEAEEAGAKIETSIGSHRKWWKKALATAAVLLVLLAIPVTFYLYKPAQMPIRTPHVIEAVQHSMEVTLPCGSKVIMNKNTEIAYIEETYAQNREINLSGEAYLMVVPKNGAPFTVNTQDLRINVLGTTFNVNAGENNSQTVVSLYEGNVEVETGNGIENLTSQQELCWNSNSNSSSVQKISGREPAWLASTHIVSMSDIVGFIRKNYKMTVIVDEAVDMGKLFFFRFNYQASIYDMQALLSEIDRNINYEIANDTVHITNLD
jgi:hypothetical protein